jgi:predicted RNA-binding protein YlqC (UPF0109 family)
MVLDFLANVRPSSLMEKPQDLKNSKTDQKNTHLILVLVFQEEFGKVVLTNGKRMCKIYQPINIIGNN